MTLSRRGLFVTATDTNAGKTWVTAGCLRMLRGQNLRVVGYKPVASGARMTEAGLRNADADILFAESNISATYEDINPFCFEPAIAPHIAAQVLQQEISIPVIMEKFAVLCRCADFVIVEGVGGWRVPLNQQSRVSDLAGALQLPVLLVVGLRLGCLNHAQLSMEAIRKDGVPVAGWLATQVDKDYPYVRDTLQSLNTQLGLAPLAYIPWIDHFDAAIVARYLAGALGTLML